MLDRLLPRRQGQLSKGGRGTGKLLPGREGQVRRGKRRRGAGAAMTTTRAEQGATGIGAVAARMAAAASEFMEALASDQRATAMFALGDEAELRRWYYTPTQHGGLALADMDANQQRLAQRLVASGLSAAAQVTASTIMGLENTLDAREGGRALGYPGREGPSRWRDPMMYFLSVFGEPGGPHWGWRFGGHHVSLHYTIVDGAMITPTPTFFGANPAESSFVGGARLRPLGREEDLARELLRSLDEEQRTTAVISAAAPPDIVQSNRSRVEEGALPLRRIMGDAISESWAERMWGSRPGEEEALGFGEAERAALRYERRPKGQPAATMRESHRDLLRALIQQYVERMPEEIAAVEASKLTGQALDEVHFAWAGGVERGEPHYYRLQGSRFLVEYDNTQNDANHIHSVWRDPDGDFGAEILAQHYARAH